MKLWFFCTAIFLLAACSMYVLRYDFRSYSLLTHVLDPQASNPLLRLETHGVNTQEAILQGGDGPVRARLYSPIGVAHPSGIVVVPGIHHLGIDEPRLVSFARAAAGSGFAVMTPEVAALADYRVDASSIPTIGESALWLQERLGAGPVTVIGVSFAGGLALLAASDSRFTPHIRALFLIGAYDDLGRVSRFLATNRAELPDGTTRPYTANEYGASIFIYSHMTQFFSVSDIPAAREALRFLLWEEPEKAKPLLAGLSPSGKATLEVLLAQQLEQLKPQLLNAIHMDEPELSALSMQGKLNRLRTPVFLLHGATDDIIPSTETLWLQKEIPAEALREVLITPVFSHVDADKRATWRNDLRLVGFLADVLRASEN